MTDVSELLARLDRVTTQRGKFAVVEVSQVLLTDCAAMIRALDETCTEWANVSQANYQRAKAAEAANADMLEAMKGLERVLLCLMDDPSRADEIPAVIAARAAIAKAEGKP